MWLIYLISILDNLFCISILSTLLGLAGTIIVSVVTIADEDYAKDFRIIKLKKSSIILLSIFAPIALFVPDSKQAVRIFAVGTTIEYVQNNEKIKELPDKAVLCLDKFMNEYLKEENNHK